MASVPTNIAQKAGRGRPTLLTEDIKNLICQAIREGNFRETAAAFAGISRRVMYDWLALGKTEDSGIHKDFLHAVLAAESDAEIKMVEQIFRAATQDPRHAQWWLERKFPQRWGSQRAELAALKRQIAALEKANGTAIAPPPPGPTAPESTDTVESVK